MIQFKERYIVDSEGNRVGVVLDMKDYLRILEALEELESILAYDAAKASSDEIIPFEQAVAEIERNRIEMSPERVSSTARGNLWAGS